MERLFLIRHGESDGNKRQVFAGHLNTPLSEEGIAQAKAAGKKLNEDGHNFDLIIASPLDRAKDTAKNIAVQVGYPLDKIETSELVKERSFGVLEDTPSANFFADHELKHLDQVEQAETLEQMHERAAQALVYLQSRPEDNILVVSHGSFGRALRRVANGLPHTHEYSPENVLIANCEIVELI